MEMNLDLEPENSSLMLVRGDASMLMGPSSLRGSSPSLTVTAAAVASTGTAAVVHYGISVAPTLAPAVAPLQRF